MTKRTKHREVAPPARKERPKPARSRRTAAAEAVETVNAIRSGQVDALVIHEHDRDRIYALKSFAELERVNAKLQEANRRMRVAHEQLRAFAQERELFFQDMHDGCIQAIYAVGLNLEACRTLLDENPAKAARTIAAAATNLNLVIQDLRSLITDQGQQSPTARNLRSEIERAVRAVGENGPAFAVRIDAGAEQALTPDQTFHLLQIAREGISNATRHAKARKGKLSLRLRGGNFRFEVTDDGIGFDTAMADRYGLGLYHISARARRLGGEASVKSAPNEGTRIVVQIPLKR